MKKTTIWLISAALALGTASPVLAAKFISGDSATVGTSEIINGNVYAAGGTVNYSGINTGDLYTAGGTLVISGKVANDLVAAGGNMLVTGDVGDDVRAAGGSVTLNSKIGGEVMVAGGNVDLTQNVSTGKDVYLTGGTVVISGVVGGNLSVAAGRVEIRGTIKGSAKIRTDELIIGDNAVVVGNMNYSAPKETVVPGSAKIGKINYTEIQPMQKKDRSKSAYGIFALFKMIASLIFCLVIFAIFRKSFTGIMINSLTKFWANVLTGFVVMVTVPVALIILAITLLGLPFTFIGATIYGLLFHLGSLGAGAVFGTWIWYLFDRKNGFTKVTWFTITVGIILLSIISLIPIVGWLVVLAFFLALFGQISRMFYDGLRRAR